LEFIELYLDIFTSVKSHDLNYYQYQRTIKKRCGLVQKDIIIQWEINFIGQKANYFRKGKGHSSQGDLTVNIQASC
jgi:hypothetical protein